MRKNSGYRLGCAAIALVLGAAACSESVVDLGSNESALGGESGAICQESAVATGNFFVASPSGMEMLRGCEAVRGDLVIDVTAGDLSPLQDLEVVEGRLSISGRGYEEVSRSIEGLVLLGAPSMPARPAGDTSWWRASLAGLDSLQRVGGLTLSNVAASDLHDLSSLRQIDSSLEIDNTTLVDLTGLEAAEVAALLLTVNRELVTLNGLTLGKQGVADWITIAASDKLANIDALSRVVRVEQGLTLALTGLENLDALIGLQYADLAIRDNPRLDDITGLRDLRGAGTILIADNPELRRVPPFTTLESLEQLYVSRNATLEELVMTLPNFQPAVAFGGVGRTRADEHELPVEMIQVDGNSRLEHFALSGSLPTIANLLVLDNDSLQDVRLDTVENMLLLSIRGNDGLETVSASSLKTIAELELKDNPLLSLEPFAEIQTFVSDTSGNAP